MAGSMKNISSLMAVSAHFGFWAEISPSDHLSWTCCEVDVTFLSHWVRCELMRFW
jgi:hypothetical protein